MVYKGKRHTEHGSTPSFPIDFHLLDITVRPNQAVRARSIDSADIPEVPEREETEVYVYLTGVQKNGASVCVEVAGFKPFLYMTIPQSWSVTDVRSFLTMIRANADVRIEQRWKFFGYESRQWKFAKLSFNTIREYNIFASKFSKRNKQRTLRGARHQQSMQDDAVFIPHNCREAFDVHMRMNDLSLFFQIATDITVSKWVRIEEGTASRPFASTSHCVCAHVGSVGPNDDIVGLPPLNVASYDIEAYSPTGDFPKSHIPTNKIINIGIVISTYPGKDTVRIVLCLGQASPSTDPATTFLAFEDEGTLLSAFRDIIQGHDVDIVTGYNIFNFDYQFMCDRFERMVKMRKIDKREWLEKQKHRLYGAYSTYEEFLEAYAYFSTLHTSFPYQSRLLDEECKFMVKELNSSAMGQNVMYRFDKPGRPDIDMWTHVKNNFKLDSYKLDEVSKHFLGGDGKIDLNARAMFALYEEGTPEALSKIAEYCVKDCDLPLALIWKLNILENANEMAVVCSTKISDIFTRGQQIKAYNLICRHSLGKNYVVNVVDITKPDSYVGATVLDPIPGYHEQPIATLDFASLYPSIMRANNLCYSTLILKRSETPEDHAVFFAGGKHHRFAKSTTRKGILPEILSELLSARKIAKKAMKKAKDPFTKSIQNGRQLALKIACNSIYGFTGVGRGYLPCWPIAATTTTIGRQMIEDSKRISEEAFPAAQCIYGDSVSGKTPLLLRIDGEVRILPIEKVELTDEHPVYTWTEKGWTRVERVICHKLAEHKKMLRVLTHSGIVDCTDDHSLLTESGMPISPDDVEVGTTELLHSYPMEFGSCPSTLSEHRAKMLGDAFFRGHGLTEVPYVVLNGSEAARRAFLGQAMSDPIDVYHERQEACAGVYYLLRSLGYPCVVAQDKQGGFRVRASTDGPSGVVREIVELPHEEYVYDLTTENHHFQAGIGNMIVHNTDSVMIKFTDLPSSMAGMKECFQRGLQLGDTLTDFFSQQTKTEGIIIMEMEKACWPFLNWPEKKRYVSRYYEHPDGKPKIDAKGVQLVRRDGAPILPRLYKEVVDCIMPLEGGVKGSTVLSAEVTAIIESMLRRIAEDEIPLEDYCIAKSLRNTYKNNNMPHVRVAEKIRERIEQGLIARDPPKSGDRLKYVIVRTDTKKKLFERSEDPEWALKHKVPIDRAYYIEQQLMKPLVGLVKYFVDVQPLFQRYLNDVNRRLDKNRSITDFFSRQAPKRKVAPAIAPKKQKKKSKAADLRSFFKPKQ